MKRKISKIAIPNRGEIAVRLISTCLEMDITPVLLYSEADKNSLAYRLSPEKVCIGPGESQKSYLSVPAVLEGALRAKAEAIHPGYGFLSEKAQLAQACAHHNLIFIGPSAEVLEIFGDKVWARKQAVKCGLPVLKAWDIATGKDALFGTESQAEARRNVPADPAVIKSVRGGGGRGLRVVRFEHEWESALLSAKREAQLAFGSSEVFVEQYLPFARHIEVQVFVSAKGEPFYLFDRDCSIQRRYQKIIEEAPSHLPKGVKKDMAEASIALLNAVGYRQAGTVEFLYHEGKFYFMEVNPRIQVECPVTEEILGVDLIKAQILTAEGREPFEQKSFEIRGHSLQCRIYAEDMGQKVPVFGQLGSCYFPHGVGRRFDMGYESGDQVPAFYDSLLGKLISYGENREDARKKMKQALYETVIFGLKTNISFLRELISHKSFIKGDVHTRFVEEAFLSQGRGVHSRDSLNPELISALQKAFSNNASFTTVESNQQDFNPWAYFAPSK